MMKASQARLRERATLHSKLRINVETKHSDSKLRKYGVGWGGGAIGQQATFLSHSPLFPKLSSAVTSNWRGRDSVICTNTVA
jgi:hypothetical protein